jgi:phosphate transport system permease protein
MTTPTADPPERLATTRHASGKRLGDRIFLGASRGSALFLLVVLAANAAFLAMKALPAVTADEGNFLTERAWNPDANPPVFGIAALAWGTLVSSVVALALALPVGVGIALFISHYAPRRFASVLAYVVDLLAAVPSVIYGLWGARWLIPRIEPIHVWLNDHFGWIPFFGGTVNGARTLFTAGVVLAIMILPIIAAVCREVFLQVPTSHEEAALALGATRWEMIRTAVLPFGRPGVISAAMLGLGRALGETIAVAMVLSVGFNISLHLLEPNAVTFASNIALKYSEAQEVGLGALVASGLVLFVITLVVNMVARMIIARRKEFSGAAA